MKNAMIVLLALGSLLTICSLGMLIADKQIEIRKLQKQEEVVNKVTDAFTSLLMQGDGVAATRQPVAERVQLPDVEGHFWLTFLYADQWQRDADTVRLNAMFHHDPRLVAMRRRCRVNTFGQMDAYLVERWRKYVGDQTPMLVLQAPDGQLCFKASRGNIPASADELVAQIQASLDEHFRRPCPQPEPAPAPLDPQPTPVSPLPDTIGPADKPHDAGDPLWLLAVLGVGGVAIGVVLGRKRR